MQCPLCEGELVISGLRKYTTLEDHVSNPNGPRPIRPVWSCFNTGCRMKYWCRKRIAFWGVHGGFYSSSKLRFEAYKALSKRAVTGKIGLSAIMEEGEFRRNFRVTLALHHAFEVEDLLLEPDKSHKRV